MLDAAVGAIDSISGDVEQVVAAVAGPVFGGFSEAWVDEATAEEGTGWAGEPSGADGGYRDPFVLAVQASGLAGKVGIALLAFGVKRDGRVYHRHGQGMKAAFPVAMNFTRS